LEKERWAMDWYYPILGGVVRGGAAEARLASKWDTFVADGRGVRCVSDQPWITAAETCELVMALDAIGRVQRGEWKVRDPADWVRVLVDVARLEAGQPTSASIVAHVGREAAAGVLALREQARAALGESSAVAADSTAVVASPVLDSSDGGSGAVGASNGGEEPGGG
jgi:hypothetical protein